MRGADSKPTQHKVNKCVMRSDFAGDGVLPVDGAKLTGGLRSQVMARAALAAGATGRVVSMCFDGRSEGSVLAIRSVAAQAYIFGRLPPHRIVRRSMRIVAAEAGNSPCIH